MNKEQILVELQMLTGVMSNDVMYLYNLLVSKPKDEETIEEIPTKNKSVCGVALDLDKWFAEFGGVK